MEDDFFQAHYLKEEKAESLDALGANDLKWKCLGAACRSSCCFFAYSRISLHEIVPLSKYFPVIFCAVVPEGGEREIAVCILRRVVKDNNYCTYLKKGEGCVLKEERPLSCKQYPFSVDTDQSGSTRVLVRQGCPGFSEDSGHSLVMPGNSRISSYVERECIRPAISRHAAREETNRFVGAVTRHDLIAPGQYAYRGESIPFNLVDAKKLYGLPGDVLDGFRANGYMELVHAHMNSLVANCTRLIDVYLERKTADCL